MSSQANLCLLTRELLSMVTATMCKGQGKAETKKGEGHEGDEGD